MRVYPGIENILEKLTLRILLSKIGPQNFGKVVHKNENALRSLNLAWTLGSFCLFEDFKFRSTCGNI